MKYFGTDGIRDSVAGAFLAPDFVRRLARAACMYLKDKDRIKGLMTVVIGHDARASGPTIERHLIEGFSGMGVRVLRLGTVPTPAVAMAVLEAKADLGISITASHNPAEDNGVKFCNARGMKFTDVEEAEIEAVLDGLPDVPVVSGGAAEEAAFDIEAIYVRGRSALLGSGCLRGRKVVLDTANGATFKTSAAVLRAYGAEVVQIGGEPDGFNINAGIGSEHPERLAAAVRANKGSIGIAHDGDGDRVLFCDEDGEVVDGDQVLGLLSLYALGCGKLKAKTAVATILSNRGLDKAVADAGGKVVRSQVGDRNVLYLMLESGACLGGEGSGHIVFLDHATTGDGLLSALKVLEVMLGSGRELRDLRRQVSLFPQAKANLKVREKRPLETLAGLNAAVKMLEAEIGERGQVILRYSGTEPKLRILIEWEDASRIQGALDALAAAAMKDLG